MLEGIYTQSDTEYGKSNSNNSYSFIPNIFIEYKLITDAECFKIEHHCAFINENMTRIIPLQDNSSLDIEMISSEFNKNNKNNNTILNTEMCSFFMSWWWKGDDNY